jgi:hypothetical protein
LPKLAQKQGTMSGMSMLLIDNSYGKKPYCIQTLHRIAKLENVSQDLVVQFSLDVPTKDFSSEPSQILGIVVILFAEALRVFLTLDV